jgi:hypothetical protein
MQPVAEPSDEQSTAIPAPRQADPADHAGSTAAAAPGDSTADLTAGAAVAPAAPAGPAAGSAGLTERDQQILAFEARWWKHAGSKEQAIRDAFNLSSTRYYQLLNALLDNPAALEHEPVLVARLRRLRSTRARTRRR